MNERPSASNGGKNLKPSTRKAVARQLREQAATALDGVVWWLGASEESICARCCVFAYEDWQWMSPDERCLGALFVAEAVERGDLP